jgi:hypothetical protein
MPEDALFVPQERYIEIEVPNNYSSLSYYETAIKVGIEELERVRVFFRKMGEAEAGIRISDSLHAMEALLETVQTVKREVAMEYQTWIVQQHGSVPQAAIMPEGES